MGADRPRSFLLSRGRSKNFAVALFFVRAPKKRRRRVFPVPEAATGTSARATQLTDRRYIKETGLEARIAAIVEPIAADLGYRLVRVKILNQNGTTLQIMAEDSAGRFTITDCEKLSQEINPALDVEDPIDREYNLEVSSPGIDRPLVRADDFARFEGHEAKIELSDLINGRRRFRGAIVASDADSVTIRLPDAAEGVDPDHKLPLSLLADAKLVMTDALLEMAAKEQELDDTLDDPEIETVEYQNDEEIN